MSDTHENNVEKKDKTNGEERSEADLKRKAAELFNKPSKHTETDNLSDLSTEEINDSFRRAGKIDRERRGAPTEEEGKKSTFADSVTKDKKGRSL